MQYQQSEFIQASPLPMLSSPIQEVVPLPLSPSPSQFRLPIIESKKPVMRTTDDLRIIDDIPDDNENCVDYDHFDRNILFSPVPRNPSDLEFDAHRHRKVRNSHPKRKIVVPPPRSDIAEFLKMCREEAVRIRAEEIAPQPKKRSSDDSSTREGKRSDDAQPDGGAAVVAKKVKKNVVGGGNRTKGIR